MDDPTSQYLRLLTEHAKSQTDSLRAIKYFTASMMIVLTFWIVVEALPG